jgi:LmbE family N-acetylglucosaminyl deacetylase
MNILCVGAHPDDPEGSAGGLLAKYARRGDAVYVCYATNGEKGHYHIPPAQLATIRRGEAEAACRVLGAQPIFLEVPDGELEVTMAMRRRVMDVLRRTRPDVVLSHHPFDYHPDHLATGQLVFDASYLASVPHFKTEEPACAVAPTLYYLDSAVSGGLGEPRYVDIGETIELKMESLAQHRSQVEWLNEHDGGDVLARWRDRARAHGIACGVRYAERVFARRAVPVDQEARLLP